MGSWESGNKPGLGAHRRMGLEDLEAWKTGAIFGLLEPLPDNWVKNEHFKKTWGHLKHDMGTLLLELDVDPEKDKVFVVDRGHMEGALCEDKKGIPEKYLHFSRRDGERAYMESRVPLKEFLVKAKELGYSMPEVVILENVPSEKISISEQQPLIEDELKQYRGEFRQGFIRDIQRIPELSRWYEQKKEVQRSKESKEGRVR